MRLFGNKGDGAFIAAPQVANNPGLIDSVDGKYIILYNQSITDFKFVDLSDAINEMAAKGWKCINICVVQAKTTIMYALMERQ
jgi:hypothetical protein